MSSTHISNAFPMACQYPYDKHRDQPSVHHWHIFHRLDVFVSPPKVRSYDVPRSDFCDTLDRHWTSSDMFKCRIGVSQKHKHISIIHCHRHRHFIKLIIYWIVMQLKAKRLAQSWGVCDVFVGEEIGSVPKLWGCQSHPLSNEHMGYLLTAFLYLFLNDNVYFLKWELNRNRCSTPPKMKNQKHSPLFFFTNPKFGYKNNSHEEQRAQH